jgi:hypothetical protein
MEKNYFAGLALDNKLELMFNYGEVIKTVEVSNLFLILFLLDDFFVEIQVDKHNNELLDIEVQDDQDVLHAYVNDVDLSDLPLKY